jgi:hypothetical protein
MTGQVENMLWNGALITALGFMVRWWMKSMENKITNFCRDNREEHGSIFKRLEAHGQQIAVCEDRTKNL